MKDSRSQGFESEKLPGFLSRVTRNSGVVISASAQDLSSYTISFTLLEGKGESLISLPTTDITEGSLVTFQHVL